MMRILGVACAIPYCFVIKVHNYFLLGLTLIFTITPMSFAQLQERTVRARDGSWITEQFVEVASCSSDRPATVLTVYVGKGASGHGWVEVVHEHWPSSRDAICSKDKHGSYLGLWYMNIRSARMDDRDFQSVEIIESSMRGGTLTEIICFHIRYAYDFTFLLSAYGSNNAIGTSMYGKIFLNLNHDDALSV